MIWKYEVLSTMNTDSVAGPDGFTTFFFKACWAIIKYDICNAIRGFFNGHPMPTFF